MLNNCIQPLMQRKMCKHNSMTAGKYTACLIASERKERKKKKNRRTTQRPRCFHFYNSCITNLKMGLSLQIEPLEKSYAAMTGGPLPSCIEFLIEPHIFRGQSASSSSGGIPFSLISRTILFCTEAIQFTVRGKVPSNFASGSKNRSPCAKSSVTLGRSDGSRFRQRRTVATRPLGSVLKPIP